MNLSKSIYSPTVSIYTINPKLYLQNRPGRNQGCFSWRYPKVRVLR